MKPIHSFTTANGIYTNLAFFSLSWLSKFYHNKNYKFFGVSLERIQAFSQFHFFCLLKTADNVSSVWDQYPLQNKKEIRQEWFRIILTIYRLLYYLIIPKQKISNFNSATQIVVLSSGRHLDDQTPLIDLLSKRFNIIVVGKFTDNLESLLNRRKVTFFRITNGYRLLGRAERLKNLLIFFFGNWKKMGTDSLLDNTYWQIRLWYLRLFQFPEIVALLTFANNMFEKTKPALLLTTSSNDTFGAAFTLVAQKHKIPVAELQHGYTNFGTDAPFYNADYQLVWGKMPQKIRKAYAKKSAVIVGCPFLQTRYENDNNQSAKILRVLVLWTPPFGSIVLFQSQENEQTLFNLIEGLANLPKNYQVTLRSHPSFDLEILINRIDLPKNIRLDNQGNFKEVVVKHDIIITQPTTAGFYAALVQKPLLFFSNSWITKKYGDPFINSGSALNVPLPDLKMIDQYISKLINDGNLLKKQQLAQEKFVKEYCAYFSKDSCKQIIKFAKKIIDEKAPIN